MTKVWLESPESDQYTEAQSLDVKDYAQRWLSIKPCGSMSGVFLSTTRLKILSEHPPSDYFLVGGLFVVSEALKTVLEDFRIHAEFFPLQINHGGKTYTEQRFFFCNIMDCLECFDNVRGKCTFWKKAGFTDRMDKIKRLAIDEKKTAGHHLFRIAKGAEYLACASDALAERIVNLKFTGMKFVGPEDWRFGM